MAPRTKLIILFVFLVILAQVHASLIVKRASGPIWGGSGDDDGDSNTKVAKKGPANQRGGKSQRDSFSFGDLTKEDPEHCDDDDEEDQEETTTPSPDVNCTCVPFYRCDEDQIVGGADIRTVWRCPSVLQVCCKIPKPTTVRVTTTSASTPTYKPRCGNLNPNGINARILGFKESETQFGEYPWMAAILEAKNLAGKPSFQFLCGGTLIWPNVIATAYHCVYGKNVKHLKIRLGEWDAGSTNEFYPHQDVSVKEIVGHSEYYAGGLYNDIALVFLSKSVVLSPHIDTGCLPLQDKRWYDNVTCFASGWGKNAFGQGGEYSEILKEVKLPIVPRKACESALKGTNLGKGFKLHKSFICAGGFKNQDTCVGDGGGPLVCSSSHDPWRYILAGIVSWGIGCGEGVPGVYTDTAVFRKWIDETISSRVSNYDKNKVSVTPIAKDP